MVSSFGKTLAELREEKGMTKSALGKALAVSHSAIVKWENGTKLPSILTFCEIADYFGVTIDYLVGREK